jgi:hypothetical protein
LIEKYLVIHFLSHSRVGEHDTCNPGTAVWPLNSWGASSHHGAQRAAFMGKHRNTS